MGAAFALTGCNQASYPEEKIESAIKEICSKEYKIEDVEVRFAGKTVGVFLPLKKLFAMDVRQEILSGQISNLESLFEPEPDAMEQLENVLFTISRVLLSSDKEIDFYVLQATDIESTGLQLVLIGYVPDVLRVRLWDIPRSEYRKRVIHELKFNRSVLWEKPVRELLSKVANSDFEELAKRYFSSPPTPAVTSPIFYNFLATLGDKQNLKVELNEIKSRSYHEAQALVYVKWTETYEPKPGVSPSSFSYPSGTALEYIFIVEPSEKQFKISQVIPFYYVDETKQLKKIPLPEELNLDRNLEVWPERFSVEEITVGEFLARQMNRRIQALLLADERIHHTIRHAQVNLTYQQRKSRNTITSGGKPYFALYFDFMTKAMNEVSQRTIGQVISDEDVLYLFELVLREFADVIRSYRFKDYQYLELVWEPGGSSSVLRLGIDRLDLFRQKKLDVATLLESPSGPLLPPS